MAEPVVRVFDTICGSVRNRIRAVDGVGLWVRTYSNDHPVSPWVLCGDTFKSWKVKV